MAETAPVVTGRERELATLRSFFAARPGLSALVLEGDTGIFRLDGRVKRRRKHAPFSARFRVRVAPGSRHSLTAHVVSRVHGLRVSHTLHSRFVASAAQVTRVPVE